MASTSTPAVASDRCALHDPRAEAEAAFERGMDLLAGVALALEGICAADTAAKAQILADMLEAGTARLVTARRFLLERAGAH